MKIFLYKNDEQFGPYSLEQVQAFIDTKSFRPTDSAWYDGCAEWTTLSHIPGVVFTPENLHQHLVPPFEAYTGDKPYIFISYAHADGDVVFREIKRLHEAGYRIWYDEGIEPGNDWPQHIAQAVVNCFLFLIFTSPRSANSENCRNEINLALNRKKKLLAIHLEETELPLGLELRMGDLQAILKYRLPQATYQKKVYASLEKFLGPKGRDITPGNDLVAQAFAQKIDSEELVAPASASVKSFKSEQKNKSARSSIDNSAKDKRKGLFWFGLAGVILALTILMFSRSLNKTDSEDLAQNSKITNRLPSIFHSRINAEKIDPTKAKAIEKGLEWLARLQIANGSWEGSVKKKQDSNLEYRRLAYTGLALMNFLAKEPSFNQGKYLENKKEALQFLTLIPGKVIHGGGNYSCYSHPMRTQALCEAYLITKDKDLLQFVGPAVQSIIDGQNPNGGWAYGYGRGKAAHTDLSVTGWNVQAVKMASYIDFPFVGIDKCLERAASYIEKCSLPGGKFAYQAKVGSNEKPSLKGAGAYCLGLTGSKNSAIVFRTMNQIIFDQPNKLSDLDYYAFYYNCQAFAAAPLIEGGSEYSQKWNTNLPSFVLKSQNKAGFWEQGAHFHGDDDGPLFRSLLMLLSLQSEYRYKYL